MSDEVEVIDEVDHVESASVDEFENSGEFEDSGEFENSDASDVAAGVEVERPGVTGDPRVDDAIARLDDLDHAPTADHVAIVDDAHRRLQSALGDLDTGAHGGP